MKLGNRFKYSLGFMQHFIPLSLSSLTHSNGVAMIMIHNQINNKNVYLIENKIEYIFMVPRNRRRRQKT